MMKVYQNASISTKSMNVVTGQGIAAAEPERLVG